MISHCANRACARPFHYLRGGRPYRFELKAPNWPCTDVPNAICSAKPSQATVFFWLCEPCSRKFSLQFNCRDGAGLTPLLHEEAKRGPAPVVAVRE